MRKDNEQQLTDDCLIDTTTTTWELLLDAYSGIMAKLENHHSDIDKFIIKTYLDMLICEAAVFDVSIDPERFEEILDFLDR